MGQLSHSRAVQEASLKASLFQLKPTCDLILNQVLKAANRDPGYIELNYIRTVVIKLVLFLIMTFMYALSDINTGTEMLGFGINTGSEIVDFVINIDNETDTKASQFLTFKCIVVNAFIFEVSCVPDFLVINFDAA